MKVFLSAHALTNLVRPSSGLCTCILSLFYGPVVDFKNPSAHGLYRSQMAEHLHISVSDMFSSDEAPMIICMSRRVPNLLNNSLGN